VFADVDPDTGLITAATAEAAAARAGGPVKAVLPVDFAGQFGDLPELSALARQRGWTVIEDSCHAAGTRYRGQLVGNRGTAIFSFHPIKNMTTGEGGMVCTDDNALAERVRRLKFHGLGVDAFDRQMQGRSPQAEVIEPGYKYNLTDIAAALGLAQLQRLEVLNRRRRDLALRYRDQLAGLDSVLPLSVPSYPHDHAWHLFIVRLDIERAGMTRDQFMEALKRENIGTGLHFRAVHTQKYYREHPEFQGVRLPHTEWNSERICSLPLFPDMTERDVDDVARAIKGVLKL